MIIDTDVLIWYLRGNERARIAVETNLPFSISAVTYMELLQGMKDRNEYRRFQRQIHQWGISILHIDGEISARAMFYLQEYVLSHSMRMGDALIAATVVQSAETLLTANDRHYRFIPGIECERFEPSTSTR